MRSTFASMTVVAAVTLLGVACSGSGGVAGTGGSGGPGDASGGRTGTGGHSGTGGIGGSASVGGAVGSGGAGGVSGTGGFGNGGAATGGRATGGNSAAGGSNATGGTQGKGGSSGTFDGGAKDAPADLGSAGGSAAGGSGGGAGGASAGVDGGLSSAISGPCDILASGNTPCVAAHSTVRLLLGSYRGPLYQVRRTADSKTQDIGFIAQTGVADSAAQDTFCSGAKCTISVIYDQSGKGNHLKKSLGGAEVCKHADQEAVADALPLTLGGHRVYGIKVVSDDSGPCTPPAGAEGTGYRLDKTSGIAIGDDAETEYMVTSGSLEAHGNSGCCFDYGNVETDDKDDGAATMEALYFGGGAGWGHGGGSGPWVLADLENGVFSGSTNAYTGNTSVPYPYVTAILIGRSGGTYALMAGNAQEGELKTMYDGARPTGYTKMKKQGAIVLGTGGDNSDHGKGYFFEGVMTTGAATAATMNQVHANIVAAGYGK